MAEVRKKRNTAKAPTTVKAKATEIDWDAMGYSDDDEEYQAASEVKVNVGPAKFKVQAGKKYRVGFPFVKPKGKGFEVRVKPIEHLKYFDEDTQTSVKFIMPKSEKLHQQVVDIFTTQPVSTHYLTPIIVYDTNDEGKLLSRKEVSYSLKVIAIPAGRFAKLKEASEQFSLANYDFMISLDGDEKTEMFQKMNFQAITGKDLNSKTATWQKGTLVTLPDDEESEETDPVETNEVIAQAYALAEEMEQVLGTRVLKDSKIKEILEEWSDVEEDEEDEFDTEAEEDEAEDEFEEETDEESDTEDEDEDPEFEEED